MLLNIFKELVPFGTEGATVKEDEEKKNNQKFSWKFQKSDKEV
jgi:hypothetical protein